MDFISTACLRWAGSLRRHLSHKLRATRCLRSLPIPYLGLLSSAGRWEQPGIAECSLSWGESSKNKQHLSRYVGWKLQSSQRASCMLEQHSEEVQAGAL